MPHKGKSKNTIPDQYKKEHKKVDYKIYPPRKEQDFVKIDRDLHPFYASMFSKNGSCLLIAAPPGSGKTSYISNLLGREEYFKGLFDNGVFVCSPTINNDIGGGVIKAVADHIEDEYTETYARNMFKMLSGGDDVDSDDEGNGLSCLLFDDCMGAFKMNTFVGRLCSMCRHLKSLIIFSNQRVVGVPSNIRANISHTVVYNQPSKKELERIIELHSCFGGEDTFLRLYNHACSVRYGALMCDFRDMNVYKQEPDTGEIIQLFKKYNDDGSFNKNPLLIKDIKIEKNIKEEIPEKKDE